MLSSQASEAGISVFHWESTLQLDAVRRGLQTGATMAFHVHSPFQHQHNKKTRTRKQKDEKT
jgi:hypothetical protein